MENSVLPLSVHTYFKTKFASCIEWVSENRFYSIQTHPRARGLASSLHRTAYLYYCLRPHSYITTTTTTVVVVQQQTHPTKTSTLLRRLKSWVNFVMRPCATPTGWARRVRLDSNYRAGPSPTFLPLTIFRGFAGVAFICFGEFFWMHLSRIGLEGEAKLLGSMALCLGVAMAVGAVMGATGIAVRWLLFKVQVSFL